MPYISRYDTYQTVAGTQSYQGLPNPDTNEPFIGWYYLDSTNVPKSLQEGDPVLLNQHNFYENSFHSVNTTSDGEGSIQASTAQAIASETVDFSLIPESGYKVEDGSVKVMAGATAVAVTEEGDLTYSFTMPASNVIISATFVADGPTPPGPKPGPTPEPTPTPDVDPATDTTLLPVTGDAHGVVLLSVLLCMGTALLGMAGILMLRRQR